MAGIKLIREATTVRTGNSCYANWPMKVTAVSEEPGLDSNIFVYQAVDAAEPVTGDRFNNVASLQDMEILPVDAPTETEGDLTENFIPFYRTDSVELDFNNISEMERAWAIIKHDAKSLVREYRSSHNLKLDEVFHTDE